MTHLTLIEGGSETPAFLSAEAMFAHVRNNMSKASYDQLLELMVKSELRYNNPKDDRYAIREVKERVSNALKDAMDAKYG